MERLTLTLPTMYGDHHVVEVRRILLEMPGVEEVYASSCFQVVEVAYDPARLDADAIRARLEANGYLQELPVPVESGDAAYGRNESEHVFRHTTAYEGTQQVVSFARDVNYTGRPLWPCPGLGVIEKVNDNG